MREDWNGWMGPCPKCGSRDLIFDHAYGIGEDQNSSTKIDLEIWCNECGKLFYITFPYSFVGKRTEI
jgi:DNA-directed RNA polymerase subunit RPC12/RpoP